MDDVIQAEQPSLRFFHPDGKPFVSDSLMPAVLQWAMTFETIDRRVAESRTLYGERLSTVYLGLEHGFVAGRPLIFEAMLFAPEGREQRYPHHELTERYATEDEARECHNTLKLQCLIPPRWRHFLLWTVGRDRAWSFWGDEDEDFWT